MVMEGARRPGRWAAVMAVLFIVAGIFAIGEPIVAGLAVALLVGWVLIVSAIAHLVGALTAGGRGIWQALIGVVHFIGGMYLATHPLTGLTTLTLLLASVLLVEAVVGLFLYAITRALPGAGWRLANALVPALLSIMVWTHWPSSSVWAIGTLVGVNLLMTGVSRLVLGVGMRRDAP